MSDKLLTVLREAAELRKIVADADKKALDSLCDHIAKSTLYAAESGAMFAELDLAMPHTRLVDQLTEELANHGYWGMSWKWEDCDAMEGGEDIPTGGTLTLRWDEEPAHAEAPASTVKVPAAERPSKPDYAYPRPLPPQTLLREAPEKLDIENLVEQKMIATINLQLALAAESDETSAEVELGQVSPERIQSIGKRFGELGYDWGWACARPFPVRQNGYYSDVRFHINWADKEEYSKC